MRERVCVLDDLQQTQSLYRVVVEVILVAGVLRGDTQGLANIAVHIVVVVVAKYQSSE